MKDRNGRSHAPKGRPDGGRYVDETTISMDDVLPPPSKPKSPAESGSPLTADMPGMPDGVKTGDVVTASDGKEWVVQEGGDWKETDITRVAERFLWRLRRRDENIVSWFADNATAYEAFVRAHLDPPHGWQGYWRWVKNRIESDDSGILVDPRSMERILSTTGTAITTAIASIPSVAWSSVLIPQVDAAEVTIIRVQADALADSTDIFDRRDEAEEERDGIGLGHELDKGETQHDKVREAKPHRPALDRIRRWRKRMRAAFREGMRRLLGE
ncbi:hypothetical protein [Bifidobacterium felsineum]|uniref:hypothetical protein n=1 Tax=Bifidobacterium felsineum TaxID=2045440 RepID=UPI001BDBB5E1|nr:hypothetical protein [Bifidobacterium felsineum]MBT1164964.1 hypothetical protein [Bifidobacterium felsineum]